MAQGLRIEVKRQSAKRKMQSLKEDSKINLRETGRHHDLPERLLEFAASVIKLTYVFPKNQAGKHLSSQRVRSSTSVGANYEEGRGAQSRPDFLHKLQLAFKEAKETLYWLRLAEKLELVSRSKLAPCLQEGNEIHLILAKSIVTAKGIAS